MKEYEHKYEYIPGDYYQICDECGRKIRNSESRKRWDGLIVCPADYEERHPQDLFNDAVTDKQSVADARPRPNSSQLYISTEIATAAVAGDTTIEVDSISGISNGDAISVQQDGGSLHITMVNGAPSGVTITLTAALTDTVSVDNAVIAYNSSDFYTQSDL